MPPRPLGEGCGEGSEIVGELLVQDTRRPVVDVAIPRKRNPLISVCGKGGTGKTVFTAMMTRALLDSGRAGKLLVIDADPALGQLSALGATVTRTMGQDP